MKKVLYTKYARERKKKYQIKTSIFEENDIKYVEKSALNEKAKTHILTFIENYTFLKDMCSNVIYLEPKKNNTGIVYPYLEGLTIDEIVKKDLLNINKLILILKIYSEKIYEFESKYYCDYNITDEFINVFGNIPMTKSRWLKYANIDLNFNNSIFINDICYVFDYEWFYNFPIPVDYIKYRNILLFYYKYGMYFNNRITLNNFLFEFGFDEAEITIYSRMENNFLEFIIDNESYKFDNYLKFRRPIKDVIESEKFLKTNIENELIEKEHLKGTIGSLEIKTNELEIALNNEKNINNDNNDTIINLNDTLAKHKEHIENQTLSLKQQTEYTEELNINLNQAKNSIIEYDTQVELLKNQLEETREVLQNKELYINNIQSKIIYKIYRKLRNILNSLFSMKKEK